MSTHPDLQPGSVVRALRADLGVSLRSFAKQRGIEPSAQSRLETRDDPKMSTLIDAASALGASLTVTINHPTQHGSHSVTYGYTLPSLESELFDRRTQFLHAAAETICGQDESLLPAVSGLLAIVRFDYEHSRDELAEYEDQYGFDAWGRSPDDPEWRTVPTAGPLEDEQSRRDCWRNVMRRLCVDGYGVFGSPDHVQEIFTRFRVTPGSPQPALPTTTNPSAHPWAALVGHPDEALYGLIIGHWATITELSPHRRWVIDGMPHIQAAVDRINAIAADDAAMNELWIATGLDLNPYPNQLSADASGDQR